MKGYKVFNPDWTCRDFQYEVGKTYELKEELEICKRGFHFCKELKNCFSYYDFSPDNKVAEIEAFGTIITNTEEDKYCTDKIKIVKELTWQEVLDLVNSGKGNIGYGNDGDCNIGCYNTYNCNTGNCNKGIGNEGSYNYGKYNNGHSNLGISNNGDCNKGKANSGQYNIGNLNQGNSNIGSYNYGSCNKGNSNNGWYNIGNFNYGHSNIGDYNNGNWNKGNFINGVFNTETTKITMFNKPSNWTMDDWNKSMARELLDMSTKWNIFWVSKQEMTDEEKEAHPEYKTTGGFLKESCPQNNQDWWNRLNDLDKETIKALPNFDKEIFAEIMGIDVNTI